ncbi:hypothetical protein RRG08_063885 [Elysia crispata]|uniref:Uncharacterized protein n=1 Tax=Elysia crispata TaxID=231223 RepID=A0AAE1BB20_9GAST|nr:hypothetical protein RRG08_063885 [Elysia crispata]
MVEEEGADPDVGWTRTAGLDWNTWTVAAPPPGLAVYRDKLRSTDEILYSRLESRNPPNTVIFKKTIVTLDQASRRAVIELVLNLCVAFSLVLSAVPCPNHTAKKGRAAEGRFRKNSSFPRDLLFFKLELPVQAWIWRLSTTFHQTTENPTAPATARNMNHPSASLKFDQEANLLNILREERDADPAPRNGTANITDVTSSTPHFTAASDGPSSTLTLTSEMLNVTSTIMAPSAPHEVNSTIAGTGRTTEHTGDDGSNMAGTIAAIVITIILVIAFIAGFAYLYFRRRW